MDPLANEMLWKQVQRRGARLPYSPAKLGKRIIVSGAKPRVPTWRDAFVASMKVDNNWKAGRLEREVRHGHHGLVSSVSIVGNLTVSYPHLILVILT